MNKLLVACSKVFVLFLLFVMAGCETPYMDTWSEEKNIRDLDWECEYKEEYFVQTEPQGCRVYVEGAFKGDSPVKGTFKMKFTMRHVLWQDIEYRGMVSAYTGARLSEEEVSRSNTLEFVQPRKVDHYYTVKAFKPGYRPAEERVNIHHGVIGVAATDAKVIETDDGPKLNTRYYTRQRPLFLTLDPIRKGKAAYEKTHRSWTCEYQEEYFIQTEPQGCRVYVQEAFKGDSPVKGTLDSVKFTMNRYGKQQKADVLTIDYDGYHETVRHPASWEEDLTPGMEEHYYTIKAFKPGYRPAEQRVKIHVDDDVFCRATAEAKVTETDNGSKLNTKYYTGQRTLLLTLDPLPQAANPPISSREKEQQQQQQQTVVLPGAGSSASSLKGSVLVSSNPENGEVYLDGIFAGNTPTKLSLKEGIHIIEVKREGYKPFRREFRVLADSELSIRATLEK